MLAGAYSLHACGSGPNIVPGRQKERLWAHIFLTLRALPGMMMFAMMMFAMMMFVP